MDGLFCELYDRMKQFLYLYMYINIYIYKYIYKYIYINIYIIYIYIHISCALKATSTVLEESPDPTLHYQLYTQLPGLL